MVKRISQRLKQLELSTAQEAATANRMLVELIARRDALFFPWRGRAENHGHLFFEQMNEVWAGKRGFSAKASGVADWQTASEQRSMLIDRGLAKPLRTKGGEINALKITPMGDAIARALVGDRLYTFNDPLPRAVYAYMCCMFDVCQPWLFGRWMSESLLWQRPLHGDPAAWQHLDEAVLPLLTAGLVKQSYDIPGRVYYSLRHWDAVGRLEVQEHTEPTVEIEADPDMDDIYAATYDSERTALSKLEATAEVHIPIPASCFHAFMGESTAQPKQDASEDDHEGRERFQTCLQTRQADTKLQALIESLQALLGAASKSVELKL